MTCRLCLNERPLRRSHIVPESLYKPAYDEKHRAINLSLEDGAVKTIQKGLREPLLCDQCEGFLNDEYEKPTLNFFSESIPDTCNTPRHAIEDVDYERVKLMLLSVLWRASVATDGAFAPVSLGPKHAERIRLMLLSKCAPPEHEYPILGVVLVNPDSSITMKGVVLCAQATRYEGHRVNVFIFGGCAWYYFVSSHPLTGSDEVRLRERGSMRLVVKSITEFEPFVGPFVDALRARRHSERRR